MAPSSRPPYAWVRSVLVFLVGAASGALLARYYVWPCPPPPTAAERVLSVPSLCSGRLLRVGLAWLACGALSYAVWRRLRACLGTSAGQMVFGTERGVEPGASRRKHAINDEDASCLSIKPEVVLPTEMVLLSAEDDDEEEERKPPTSSKTSPSPNRHNDLSQHEATDAKKEEAHCEEGATENHRSFSSTDYLSLSSYDKFLKPEADSAGSHDNNKSSHSSRDERISSAEEALFVSMKTEDEDKEKEKANPVLDGDEKDEKEKAKPVLDDDDNRPAPDNDDDDERPPVTNDDSDCGHDDFLRVRESLRPVPQPHPRTWTPPSTPPPPPPPPESSPRSQPPTESSPSCLSETLPTIGTPGKSDPLRKIRRLGRRKKALEDRIRQEKRAIAELKKSSSECASSQASLEQSRRNLMELRGRLQTVEEELEKWDASQKGERS